MNEQILKDFIVLCVEDEDGIRKRLVNTLKYYFKDVLEASNGEDGYDLYYEYKPDIIISDIQMPKKNGIEMIEKIRENDINTPIITLTAYSSEEYLLSLINLNINHYILKPANAENLLEGIKKVFSKKFSKVFEFNEDCKYDLKTRDLIYKGKSVNIRKRDKDFLTLLCENENRVLTYSFIEEYIWKDRIMSMTALKTFIKEFRKRIPIELIENISQEGYKLKTH